jgi:ATP-dependent RNA helicase DHX8/PRP22
MFEFKIVMTTILRILNLSFGRALATGQSVQIHPSSVLFRTKPDCVVFNGLVRTTQNYVKNLTRIDLLWLAELAPQYYATEE